MKKITQLFFTNQRAKLFRALSIIALGSTMSIQAQTYCIPPVSSAVADDEIAYVMFGTMSNTTTCNVVAPGPGSIPGAYSNFTGSTGIPNLPGAIPAPVCVQGLAYPLAVGLTMCSSFAYSGIFRVWIDYNQNGVFSDPGEMVWTSTYGPGLVSPAFAIFTAPSVTIPLTATPGLTRMRVWESETSVAGTECQAITWGETEDYPINIVPNTPCNSMPVTNTISPASFTTCPGLGNPILTLNTTYTVGGITYQWQSSTVSPVGPFTSVTNATMSSAPLPTLGVTTWYQAVVTCTNTNQSVTIPVSQILVAGTTTNSVPYYEDFEGIQLANRLPNCSWAASNVPGSTQTYISSNTNNRVPHSGTKFASFFNSPAGVKYFYSNGVQLEPGITYSANIWYATEYFGYSNWTNLSVMVGTGQSPTGLVPIASTSPAISGAYKALGGTFTVPSSGLYYIAIRATAAAGSALYLSWDDLSVTIPCTPASGNSPTLSVSAGNATICAGEQTGINANGAALYSWNNGATGSSILVSPVNTTTYTVTGSNTLTGCTQSIDQVITVLPSPSVMIVADKPQICPGQTAFLSGYGANAYAWSNGSNGNVISVSPTVTSTYILIGTNLAGCATTSSVSIIVKPLPSISALTANNSEICAGEGVMLTATGGTSYDWYSSSSSVLYQGNPVTIPLYTSTTFTVIGVGANGCSNRATVSQNVQPCVGLEKMQSSINGLNLYPNPANSKFTVELTNGQISAIVITDISGRVVMDLQGAGSKMLLDISTLSNGVYYATITSEESSEVVRIIKN